MDKLLATSNQIIDKASKQTLISGADLNAFGSALIQVQTEVQRQKPIRDPFGTD